MNKRELKLKIKKLERELKEINKILNSDKIFLREFSFFMYNKKDKKIDNLYKKREKLKKELIDLRIKYCDILFKEISNF